MADYKVSKRLLNSCTNLSNINDNLPHLDPILSSEDIEKCENINKELAVDEFDTRKFEKKLFGSYRIDNKNKYKNELDGYRKSYKMLKENFNNISDNVDTIGDIKIIQEQSKNNENSAKRLLINMNNSIYNLKKKINNDYSKVENKQYKDLVLKYQTINNYYNKEKKLHNDINYINRKNEITTKRNRKIRNINTGLISVLVVLLLLSILLGLVYQFA